MLRRAVVLGMIASLGLCRVPCLLLVPLADAEVPVVWHRTASGHGQGPAAAPKFQGP